MAAAIKTFVTLVVFIVLLSVHGVVVLVFVVKVVVGVVGQVAEADGDDGWNVRINFFGTPAETRIKPTEEEEEEELPPPRFALPPDEGLEGLDAILSQLVVVYIAELHHQRDDLLQVLP